MNPRVLRRFVILLAILTFVSFSVWGVIHMVTTEAPGDYYVREGDILLSDKKYDAAIARFDKALAEQPDHRGALMGRALSFMQSARPVDAEAEFTYLIKFLTRTLQPDDSTGRGTLATAYANRGILHDRHGRYKKAFADYVEALKTDMGVLDGPTVFDKILYGTPRPSTVQKRAIYLKKQFELPPEKRLMRVPEIDAQQRMYKP
ncbi:MAG: tetratricopeptide repeat protein [Alphaproteobacteria bacterium]